jgi:hypothetical protein
LWIEGHLGRWLLGTLLAVVCCMSAIVQVGVSSVINSVARGVCQELTVD